MCVYKCIHTFDYPSPSCGPPSPRLAWPGVGWGGVDYYGYPKIRTYGFTPYLSLHLWCTPKWLGVGLVRGRAECVRTRLGGQGVPALGWFVVLSHQDPNVRSMQFFETGVGAASWLAGSQGVVRRAQ